MRSQDTHLKNSYYLCVREVPCEGGTMYYFLVAQNNYLQKLKLRPVNNPTDESNDQTDDSNDDEPVTTLRPPENKKSFIDIIAGMSGSNISYASENNEVEDKRYESSEVDPNILEVFKKNSISSLDSSKSGGSLKFKPIVCPLDSCYKYVSGSDQ